MKKLKESYDSFAQAMQNRRIRAIVILSLYAIFFLLVILLINFGGNAASDNSSNTNVNKEVENKLNYSNVMSEYNFMASVEVNIDDSISKYRLTGQKTKETNEEITVELYNEESKEYENVERPDFIKDNFIYLSNIVNYVNNMEYEFSTEYKDGSIMKSYLVPINSINSNLSSNEKVEINIYELDKTITKIIVNSTEYEKLNNDKIENVLYTIEYIKL